nr:immunoglobulin heavy chain junction region [Macaca mulatta]MOV46384.1 immunoglobulin heavy chain junction region [Macaca mulatta]
CVREKRGDIWTDYWAFFGLDSW